MNQSDRNVKLLKDIINIYSPTGHEYEISKFIKEYIEELGFKNVKVDEANNVYGEIGSGNPRILLCGHIDTVPEKIQVKEKDGEIYGRGSSDAKAPLASMLIATSNLSRDKFNGKIIFVGVVDEEGSGNGIKQVLKDKIDVDYAIFGEPSGIDNITIGYKGRLCIEIECNTKSVHASAPWLSENSIDKITEVWKEIKQYVKKNFQGSRYNSLSSSITKIYGGNTSNVTPENAKITLDFRIPHEIKIEEVIMNIEGIISKFNKKNPSTRTNFKIIDEVKPFEINKNSKLLRALIRSILKIRGKQPKLVKKTGTGDMNTLGNQLKIPVLTYGPGYPHLSHTVNECVNIEEYLESIKIYEETIKELARL